MKDGLIKVAAASPMLKIGDPLYNADNIAESIEEAAARGASVLVFPELAITSYSAADLFLQRTLLDGADAALRTVVKATKHKNMLTVLGMPLRVGTHLYDTAAVLFDGKVLGAVPKAVLNDGKGNYESRYFTPVNDSTPFTATVAGESVPFGTDLVFEAKDLPELTVGVSFAHAVQVENDVNVLACLDASMEEVGKNEAVSAVLAGKSIEHTAAVVYANADITESTTDGVCGGAHMIYADGKLLSEKKPFAAGMTDAIVDVYRLADKKAETNSKESDNVCRKVYFDLEKTETETPVLPQYPFVADGKDAFAKQASYIRDIQSYALAGRLEHARAKTAVLGISGGLDSTLALLVTAKAMDILGRSRKDILCITMPCFGTTVRTKNNAVTLSEALGTTVKTVDIKRAVDVHFEDISHDTSVHDVTYENAQARERTQVLMDIANQTGGIVVGTGDLSEVALGWSTYNGDHMSMYGVNASIPKTLVRALVSYDAETVGGEVGKILADIVDTPVSPELLPAENGKIAQKTEEIVGPYALHDFFLYYGIGEKFTPKKLFRMAVAAFDGIYTKETVLKWMRTFYRRFFMQQFKRSCIPDGPKVLSPALSPRGAFRMPSDAVSDLWLKEIDEITL